MHPHYHPLLLVPGERTGVAPLVYLSIYIHPFLHTVCTPTTPPFYSYQVKERALRPWSIPIYNIHPLLHTVCTPTTTPFYSYQVKERALRPWSIPIYNIHPLLHTVCTPTTTPFYSYQVKERALRQLVLDRDAMAGEKQEALDRLREMTENYNELQVTPLVFPIYMTPL